MVVSVVVTRLDVDAVYVDVVVAVVVGAVVIDIVAIAMSLEKIRVSRRLSLSRS